MAMEQETAVEGLSKAEQAIIIEEATARWKACYDWESASREKNLVDLKFTFGDSTNMFQWPDDAVTARGGPESDRPILTVNKTRQNMLLIVNDARKNKPAITFRPTGNGATAQSALMWNGIARHIEGQSLAQSVYDKATTFMVSMGVGYWVVKTEYKNDRSFDQEIFIRQIKNPFSVMLDMDAKEPDQCDARYGFITEDVAKDDFGAKHPKYAGIAAELTVQAGGQNWITKDHIRVAEYYRQEVVKDTLYAYVASGATEPQMLFKSELNDILLEKVLESNPREREVQRKKVFWYLIVGDRVVEKKPWAGKYIPIVMIVGEETIIENKLDRKGHTRYLKDPQRMYNYFSSSAVEYGALQTKSPWLAPAQAIEEHEEDWNVSNVDNKSVLTYNAIDDAGNVIPPPTKIPPPISAPLCVEGMQIASNEIMMASGQYQASLGAQGNERSAKAIMERQRQGDTATYHFIDALGIGIRKTGKIIYDLALKVYDTKRIMQITQEDGKTLEVQIDPAAKKAYEERQAENAETIERIFNPSIGEFEVLADVGPDWGTKREEAFNAFSMLLGQAPQLIPLLADLLLRSGDFPMANTAAERLYRMLPPQAKGDGPTPNEQAMEQRISALSESLMSMIQEKSMLQLSLKGKDQSKLIDAFKAVTDRLKVIGDQAMSAGDMKALVEDTLREALGIDVTPAADASAPVLDEAANPGGLPPALTAPIIPHGARVGSDGRNYMKDYSQSPNYRAQ